MAFSYFKNTFLFFLIIANSCRSKIDSTTTVKEVANKPLTEVTTTPKPIVVGANATASYLPLLKNKNVAVVANQTSVIFKENGYTHLVDSLVRLSVSVRQVFAPEHGFRGKADAGEKVTNAIDTQTGIPIFSLYGNYKKPTQEQLQNIDVVVFDIQDVGARFYTYISTLHYIMEACAENSIPLLILDRPNPNGHYVDGPILTAKNKSFVGMHPVPMVHGMTIGEYAKMIRGESWLNTTKVCSLKIIPVKNYTHSTSYNLPIAPSPNLPNATAINLYPSLCLFEGTSVSVGRGTNKQFQLYGAPNFPKTAFTFTPMPNEGAKHPKHEGKLCYGYSLEEEKKQNAIDLEYLLHAYSITTEKNNFFKPFFLKLAGTKLLQQQIEAGKTATEIKASWQTDLNTFKAMRFNYLLYE